VQLTQESQAPHGKSSVPAAPPVTPFNRLQLAAGAVRQGCSPTTLPPVAPGECRGQSTSAIVTLLLSFLGLLSYKWSFPQLGVWLCLLADSSLLNPRICAQQTVSGVTDISMPHQLDDTIFTGDGKLSLEVNLFDPRHLSSMWSSKWYADMGG
jgi:hypothetical protein